MLSKSSPANSGPSANATTRSAGLYHFHAGIFPTGSGDRSYGRRLSDALVEVGHPVTRQLLPGPYPDIDPSSVLAAAVALSRLPDGAAVLIDADTLTGVAGVLVAENRRLVLVAVVSAPVWWNEGEGVEQAIRRNVALGALSQMHHVVIEDASLQDSVASLGIDGSDAGPIRVVAADDAVAVAALARVSGIMD